MNLLFKASYYVFLVALVAVGVLFISTFFPIPGNIQIKTVLSDSMEPAIRAGSIVIVKPVESYTTGDIIAFGENVKDETFIVKRIFDREVIEGAFLFTTKADASNNPDLNKVRQNEVIGKVFVSIPYLGFLIDSSRKPAGFVIIVGILALVFMYDHVKSIWSGVRKTHKKKRLKKTMKKAHTEKEERLERKKMRVGVTYTFAKAPGPENGEEDKKDESTPRKGKFRSL